MIHAEGLMNGMYEVRHDNADNGIHVYTKNGMATIFPSIEEVIAYFSGTPSESFSVPESVLCHVYGSDLYAYDSIKEMYAHTLISEEEFFEKYKPITNADGSLREGYHEWDTNRDHLWSEVETDAGLAVVAGMRYVNVTRYLQTEYPHNGRNIEVMWDTEIDSLTQALR